MTSKTLVGMLLALSLTMGFESVSKADANTKAECDRLISAIEQIPPADAYDALQRMRIFRQGTQYQACVDTGPATRDGATLRKGFRVDRIIGADVVNGNGVDIGNVDRVARGSDQQDYVLVTYRGPRWPGNKQVALPLARMRFDGERLLISGIGEEELLRMPTVDGHGSTFSDLGRGEIVRIQDARTPPSKTGSLKRQP